MDKVFQEIIKALKPLVDIADAYEASRLDEHRPEWNYRIPDEVTLFTGRGGSNLLTLQDCLFAREVTRELQKRFIP